MHIAISLFSKQLFRSCWLLLITLLSLFVLGQNAQAQGEDEEHRDTLDYRNPHLIVLSPEYKTYKLAKQIFFLEDKEKTLIVDEVEKPNYQHRFELYPKKTINFGYTNSAFWLKFQVKNLQPEEAWFLEISYPLLDHIEFYSQKSDSTWAMIKLGDMQPFGEREINYRNFIIPLHQNDTLTRTYFIKAYTKGALQIPMEIIKSRDFYKQNATSELLYGLFYGIMIVMIFYNTVLYFALNDSNYLYYVLSILGSTIFIATI
ncbi:MAG: 7TM-DISM domain-containing protein, partial [Thermoflexibacteraceae bacterium]